MSASVLDPPVFPDLRTEEQGRIAEFALKRPALVAVPFVLTLALLATRGQVVKSVGGGPRLGRCPPASGCNVIGPRSLDRSQSCRVRSCSQGDRGGRDPRIATSLAEIAFDMIGRGLQTATDRVDSVRDPLLVELQ